MPEPIVPLPMVPPVPDEPMGVPAAPLSVVEGLVTGAGVVRDVVASSIFLPQAPSTSTVVNARAAAAAAVNFDAYMSVSLLTSESAECQPISM